MAGFRRAGTWVVPGAGPVPPITFDSLFPMVEATAPVAAAVNTSYLTTNASTRVVVTLPAIAARGQRVEIVGSGAAGWQLAQRANQFVRIDEAVTTVGTAGSIASTSPHDAIVVRCITANTEWTAAMAVGNLEVT